MLPQIGQALRDLAGRPDVRVVVPLHRNPVVREGLLPLIGGVPGITVVDPLPYLEFCKVINRADIILSDSSGAEEEGPALGKPTLVLRDITERPEAVAAGTARLVGRSRDQIVHHVAGLLDDPTQYELMAAATNPYGDGNAAVRTIGALAHFFGDGPAVLPFVPGWRTETTPAMVA
jgi:UDP-N-acetylglucosamine 2-epimerase (non-hydrolysing)